jgi:hypothetical protein
VSPPRCHRRPVIDLGTLPGLFAHDHILSAYSAWCDRWSVLPLADFVVRGKATLRLPIKLR